MATAPSVSSVSPNTAGLGPSTTSPTASSSDVVDVASKQPSTLSLYREVVQVLVGARGTSFTVHKGLLCSESDFFKAALTGGFSEAREGVVKLADEREDVFEIFITWLYSGKLVVEDEGVDATLTLMEIFRVYVFADAHQIINLKNDCSDLALWKYTSFTAIISSTRAYSYLYKNTPRGCKMQQLVTEGQLWSGRMMTDLLMQDPEELPSPYLVDMLRSALRVSLPVSRAQTPWAGYPCMFHDDRQDDTHRCRIGNFVGPNLHLAVTRESTVSDAERAEYLKIQLGENVVLE